MSWHKMTLKVIDVLALLGLRCLGTHQLTYKAFYVKSSNGFYLTKLLIDGVAKPVKPHGYMVF